MRVARNYGTSADHRARPGSLLNAKPHNQPAIAGNSIEPGAERGFASEALGRMFAVSLAREAGGRDGGLNS
jgi:hypothetical protein